MYRNLTSFFYRWFLCSLSLCAGVAHAQTSRPGCTLQMILDQFNDYQPPRSIDLENVRVTALDSSQWRNLIAKKLDVTSLNTVYQGVDANGVTVVIIKPISTPVEYGHYFRQMERIGSGKREVLISELDERLGLGLVPKTRFGKSETGHYVVIQEYRHSRPGGPNFSRESTHPVTRSDAQAGILFDYLIGNRDRHHGNWLVQQDGKLVLIDNEWSLTVYKKPDQAIWSLSDYLPHAHGKIDPALRARFLSMEPKEFDQLLRRYRIAGSARRHAVQRLQILQTLLRDERVPIDVVIELFRQTQWFTKERGVYVLLMGGTAGVLYETLFVDKK